MSCRANSRGWGDAGKASRFSCSSNGKPLKGGRQGSDMKMAVTKPKQRVMAAQPR